MSPGPALGLAGLSRRGGLCPSRGGGRGPCGRHDTNIVSRIVTWPGKQLQHLTTNEPDDGMIECAIRALELVIPEEKGKDAW